MKEELKQPLWAQFGATIDMLGESISLCPDEMWDSDIQFWYRAFHCIFWLDYYLSVDPATFQPPAPFTLSEFDPSGLMPERVYAKDELLKYLKVCRDKCYERIHGLTEAGWNERWTNGRKNYSSFEILLYNLRHIQHHTGQLNLLLRQGMNKAPGWLSQAKER